MEADTDESVGPFILAPFYITIHSLTMLAGESVFVLKNMLCPLFKFTVNTEYQDFLIDRKQVDSEIYHDFWWAFC